MGFKDLFRKKTPPGPTAGIITSYRVVDNVGEVELARQGVLRFGRSACKGFEPAAGVKVLVESVQADPRGGERVAAMIRDPSDTEYEARVAARDAQAVPAASRPESPGVSRHPIDQDLLRRLGNIAGVNAQVRGGQDPARLVLALNVDAEGTVDENRPAVGFLFDVDRLGPEHWRLAARIDDAVSNCRFWLDLTLPERPLLDPGTFDMANMPGFSMTVAKPPDHERNPLARSAFLLAWRVDGGAESPSLEEPLALEVLVMGAELSRKSFAYFLSVGSNDHWVLLKCHRGEQAFFIGLDLSTGAAEVFPRRRDVDSYQLAREFLRTFT